MFDLLDVDLFADAVWELLMSLPTNTTIYNDIKNFHQDTQPQVQLEKLFKSGLNVFKLYYRLQIVQSFLNISVEDGKNTRRSFFFFFKLFFLFLHI